MTTRASLFWAKVNRTSDGDCWEWLGAKSHKGYGWFRWGSSPVGAHRASWMLTNGTIPVGLCVCHKCDNRLCCNPGHLFIATNHGNILDAVAKGRHKFPHHNLRGEQIACAKLNADKVKWIRANAGRHLSLRAISRQLRVSHTTVQAVVHKRAWIHV